VVADIITLLFVAGIGVRGYMRGLFAQVATVGSALLLWLLFDLWFPPVDGWLQLQHPALAEFEMLRRIVAFGCGYLALVLLIMALEFLLVQRIGVMKASNHWMGAVLGLAKGVVYAVVLVWLIQIGIGGGGARTDVDERPAWMAESVVFERLALWNPVRVMSARELLEESGVVEWGERTFAQLARDPRVRSMLEGRGIKPPPLPPEAEAGPSSDGPGSEPPPGDEQPAP
jgi:hypothetical protein